MTDVNAVEEQRKPLNGKPLAEREVPIITGLTKRVLCRIPLIQRGQNVPLVTERDTTREASDVGTEGDVDDVVSLLEESARTNGVNLYLWAKRIVWIRSFEKDRLPVDLRIQASIVDV